MADISVDDFTDPDLFYQIGIEPTRIDIIMGIDGLDFRDCWERRVESSWEDTKANFISIRDLIANKETVARPQDLIDAQNLRTKREGDA